MSDSDIWVVFSKCLILPESSLDFGDDSVSFAISYVPAPGIDQAKNLLKEEFTKDKIELLDIIRCVKYSSADWNNDSAIGKEINWEIGKVRGSERILLGSFRDQESLDENEELARLFGYQS